MMIVLLVTIAHGATYYVDGNLSADCSGGTRTSYSVTARNCSASNGTIAWKNFQSANAKLIAGDTVYLRGGTYTITKTAIAPTNSGTAANSMITYSAYTSDGGTTYETVTIAGAADVTGALSQGIYLSGKSYIKVTHIIFTNLYEYMWITSSDHNEISYCTFTNARNGWNDVFYTGTATNTDNSATVLQDSNATFTSTANWKIILNTKTNAYGFLVSSSTSTTATHYTLVAGTRPSDPTHANVWLAGDTYTIVVPRNVESSQILNSSTHNWVHHNTFSRMGGFSPSSDEGGDLKIGVISSTTDLSSNNTIEYNNIYAGGHHVLAVYSGLHQVLRGNYFHNEAWFYGDPWGICTNVDGGRCGYRLLRVMGRDGYSGQSLWENNVIAYGDAAGKGNIRHLFGSYGASGNGINFSQTKSIFRYNDNYGSKLVGMSLTTSDDGNNCTTPPCQGGQNNRIYNNTFYKNGYGSIADPNNTGDTDAVDIHKQGIDFGDSCVQNTGNVIKNNIVYDMWAETHKLSGGIYYPPINVENSALLACNPDINHNFGISDNTLHYHQSSSFTLIDPVFTAPTLATDAASIVAAWQNYTVVSSLGCTGSGTPMSCCTGNGTGTCLDLTLQSSSTAIDTGTYLTQASGAGSSTTTLVVSDASYFQDGTWGSDLAKATLHADLIAIGTVGKVVQIQSIDYSTNTITLASPMTWANGAPIWLYKKSDGAQVLYGSAPDMGAHEYLYSCKTGENCSSPNKPSPFTVQRVKQ